METTTVGDERRSDERRSLEELEAEIGELSAHIDAATCRLLLALAEFERREGWTRSGARSCAQWLAWRVGLDLATARERLRVARSLETLPRIREAFSRGEVSYSKVRAMSRVATPDNEQELLEVARHGTAHHLERLARLFRGCTQTEEEARARRQHHERYLHTWTDEEGMLCLRGRLPPELGALLTAALEAASRALAEEAGSAPQSEALEPRGAAGPAESMTAAEVAPSRASAEVAPSRASAEVAPSRASAEVAPSRASAEVAPSRASAETLPLGASAAAFEDPPGASCDSWTDDEREAREHDARDLEEQEAQDLEEHDVRGLGEHEGLDLEEQEARDLEAQEERELEESLRGTTVPFCGSAARGAAAGARVWSLAEREPDERARRAADALGLLAEWALAAKGERSRGREGRFEVVLHADAEVLAGDAPVGRCGLEGGPRLPAETVRRLCCSSPVVTLAHGGDVLGGDVLGGDVLGDVLGGDVLGGDVLGGDVLGGDVLGGDVLGGDVLGGDVLGGDVLGPGHRARGISAPLWRALRSRDETCAFPGCTARRGLVVHHVEHWARGGETRLPNLLRVCRAHHWALHEGGFRVLGRAPEALRFLAPDGQLLPTSPVPPAADALALARRSRALGLDLGPQTGLTRWRGEAMDYDWAVESLLRHRRAG